MRAAILHGPEDLRVEDVPEPRPRDDELLVRVDAATTCGTDVKMWRRGHPILPPYPARFGHETAGTRVDTGERVLVGDSVACGVCRPCRAGRPQICRDTRWVLGGFAELIAAPPAALHPIPDGLDAAGAAMAEPLAAAVHAVDRAPGKAVAPDAGVLGGGPMGQMIAALLVAEGRDGHRRRPPRRAARAGRGARRAERGGARGPRRRVRGRRPPGGVARRGRGRARRAAASCSSAAAPRGTRRRAAHRARSTTTSSTSAARSTTRRPRSTARWRCSRRARSTGARSPAGPIGLDELPGALAAADDGPARKWVVLPR